MSSSNSSPTSTTRQRLGRASQVIVVSSVMFVFISYWRAAAVVLCDLASTAYYIGGIVEHAVGPAAPWFIVGVMLFSYAVRAVYIESCSMFVRGGVYRIVKEALGRTLAKVAVSALLFDYMLTGPISSVSAGQYIMGLVFETFTHVTGTHVSSHLRDTYSALGSVIIASLATLYFFYQNLLGIHESSKKALRIMIATTIMAVVILGWAGATLWIEGPHPSNHLVFQPNFEPKANPSTGHMESPLGFLEGTSIGARLLALNGWDWLSLLGVVGFFVAFGHSILAMSGEETLAQIYREVEFPKLKNFRRAAFVVFLYSLIFTGGISILAVLLIPADVRIARYGDNLIGGLAMSVYGPGWARLALNGLVVIIGSLILTGAVNTAIIGSNGVLNRVAEDGVIPDWFLKPHRRYGTTYRLLYAITALQLFTIIISRGDVLLLGEAYAFGVVWSFVFNALAMLVLRIKDPARPRGFRVPLNIRIRGVEIPIGLSLIFLILVAAAIANVLTKKTATEAGLAFTTMVFTAFATTEYLRQRRHGDREHEHIEQFNELSSESVSSEVLALNHPYRKLVAIRSPYHLDMLEKALNETDPLTTDVVVMTAQVRPAGGTHTEPVALNEEDRRLMTAVVQRAESAGKEVVPVIVSTNNGLHAVLQTAKAIGAQELIVGASGKYTPEQQLDQLAFYWINLHQGQPTPLTVRVIGVNRDVNLDLAGGSRIPTIAERRARSVADLRAAGIGVSRVLMIHDGTPAASELFLSSLTMLDRDVVLDVLPLSAPNQTERTITENLAQAQLLGRESILVQLAEVTHDAVVKTVLDGHYDAVLVGISLLRLRESQNEILLRAEQLLQATGCQVLLALESLVPQTVEPAVAQRDQALDSTVDDGRR